MDRTANSTGPAATTRTAAIPARTVICAGREKHRLDFAIDMAVQLRIIERVVSMAWRYEVKLG